MSLSEHDDWLIDETLFVGDRGRIVSGVLKVHTFGQQFVLTQLMRKVWKAY